MGSTPPTNLYKINVDGAVFAAQRAAGAGVFIRNASGSVIGAYSKKFLAPLGAIEAEAKTTELAMQMAKDLLIQEFILESDSLTLANALKESSPPLLLLLQWFTTLLLHHMNFAMSNLTM